MVNLFIERNLKPLILESEFKNSTTAINYECIICGHKSRVSINNLLCGRGCMKCKNKIVIDNQRLKYEDVYNYFKKNDCELISKEYINAQTLLDYKCSCGNIGKITYNSFKNGNRCRECARVKVGNALRFTLEEVKKIFTKEGCELLSTEYKNQKTKLRYKCNCGNEDEIDLVHFQRGQRCRFCRKEKRRVNIIKLGLIPCSAPQKYLHELFGGELNYDNKYVLDIAFPDEKIYIEFDGSGHDLSVRHGNFTQEEFDKREIKRYQTLKYDGWKLFKIVSIRNYLPTDEILKEEFNKALEWFKLDKKGHCHYILNIGLSLNDEKYGKLRKII
jgi:hypothetical protein